MAPSLLNAVCLFSQQTAGKKQILNSKIMSFLFKKFPKNPSLVLHLYIALVTGQDTFRNQIISFGDFLLTVLVLLAVQPNSGLVFLFIDWNEK